MGRLDSLYARLPLLAQNLAVTTFGVYWHWLRFGPGYSAYVAEYTARGRFTQTQWQAWQQARLRQLLQITLNAVPYYRDTWQAPARRAAEQGDLARLPLLEKAALRSNPMAFVREDVHPRHWAFHTSGSTGTPIDTIWTAPEVRRSMAVREVRSAGWAGVSFRQPRATFSGRLVEPNPNSAGPFHRYNAVERQAYLSAFHLRPDNARAYVNALKQCPVRWLTGYAVSYHLLAQFILAQRLKAPALAAVITTSEKLTPEMRAVMQAAYGCRVYEEYSTVENALFASECEHGRLHVSPDIGIVEILRPDGTACLPGEVGEVVATCLFRDYQPLVRFRLGDLAAWDDEPCPCGRAMPVIKEVVGRVEDVVIGPDGRQMVRFHGLFVNQPHIAEGQVIQETVTSIRVKVVPTADFGPADVEDISQRVCQRLGGGVNVSVETVPAIPRNKAGKFQAVISHVFPGPDVDAAHAA